MYQSIMKAMGITMNAVMAIDFGVLFVWIIAWYILYQITRLRFLLLLVIGDIVYVAYYLLRYPHPYFTSLEDASVVPVLSCLIFFLRVAATALVATGACLGLRHLQRMWKDRDKECQPTGARDGSPAAHDP